VNYIKTNCVIYLLLSVSSFVR